MPADITNTIEATKTFKTIEGMRIVITLEIRECSWPTRRSYIDQSPTPTYTELSFVGDIFRKFHKEPDNCGQCSESIRNLLPTINEPNRIILTRILDLWDEYHLATRCITLNQLNALKEANLPTYWNPETNTWMLENHPEIYNEGNVKFGNEWFVRITPDEVIQEVKQIFKVN